MSYTETGLFKFARTGPVTIDEANSLVGVLNRVTEKHNKIVSDLMSRLETMSASAKFETRELEDQVSREIEVWNTKIRKLGGVPKGLWLVDIDAGDGYYCWKYPETEINYWHEYRLGFSGRISLLEKAKRFREEASVFVTGNA